ncbi:PucR family transcriptional regulator [Clostridium sp. 'deep sea']|uniref:PucR family transcriptional regulator n=1 Tax=Clostridium sp. 'deep sea' TaxID=2779445 RepID=UPI0018965B9C|nr:PucR family transcriptional regulator [Clostridium sp. 'deep sea']QOR36248.1 PucR family transcriptional regulator [Clostridium sp. 'deep sea']
MQITINEMLNLPTFSSFKLVAGKEGLHNYVKKVGIIDHETQDMIINSFEVNEFVLSTFLGIKENPEQLLIYVQELIKARVSGLAIKDIFFRQLPQNIINYANKHAFPIFIYSKVYYEDIIMSVLNANKEKQCIISLQHKLNDIKCGKLKKNDIKQQALSINKGFKNNHYVAFCKPHKNLSLTGQAVSTSLVKYHNTHSIIPYKEGVLAIFTANRAFKVEYLINSLANIGITTNSYVIGVSNNYSQLYDLTKSINESLYACEYAFKFNLEIISYNDLGINRALLPLQNNEWLTSYAKKVITPLLTYDLQNDFTLLKTAICYVKNNGDIKLTAKELIQHSNTVRYRINKIKQLITCEAGVNDFYLELSLAISTYLLKPFSL